MASVIDSLVVVLGLDNTQFRQGQRKTSEDLRKTKEDASNTAKAIEASGKQAAAFFTKLRNEALMLFAAFTGANGVKQFVENITAGDASLGRLAKTLDMSVEDLSAWTSAVQRTGGSADAAAGTFQSLEDNLQQLATTGQSSLLPYFNAMGISMLDAHHKARPLQDILLDIAKWAEGKDPAMVAQRLRAMGFDQGTINLLLKGKGAVTGLIDESRRLGTVSAQDAAAAQARQKAWRDLAQAATSLGRTILTDLSPAIESAMQWLDKWIQANRPEIAETITRWVGIFRQKVEDAFQYLAGLDWSSIIKQAETWAQSIEASAEQAFGFIRDHWPEIQQDIKDFAKGFEDVAKAIGPVLSGINEFVKSTVGWENAAKIFFAAWAVSKFAPLLGVLTRMAGLAAGLVGAGGGAVAGGLLGGVMGKAALAAVVAEMGVDALDPKDNLGTWIDQTLPGAGMVDDWFARKLGLGRTYAEQQKAAAAAGYGDPRGIRNKNPLNLQYVPGQGAIGSDGRFGVYGTMEAGVAAAARQLLLYQDRDHLNTISGIINKWAPPSDHNDTAAYIQQVAGLLKVDPNQPINLHDQNMMAALVLGMAKHETGRSLNPGEVLRGVGQAIPSPGISPLAVGSAGGGVSAASRGATNNTSSTQISVNGPIAIHTQATDANGIASSFIGALRNQSIVQQSNVGLN